MKSRTHSVQVSTSFNAHVRIFQICRKMLEKSSDMIIKQSSSFSIDSLLSNNKETLDTIFNKSKSSASPPHLSLGQPSLYPQMMFPRLIHPANSAHLLRQANNNQISSSDGIMPSNLPFDLLAQTYMNGILGELSHIAVI